MSPGQLLSDVHSEAAGSVHRCPVDADVGVKVAVLAPGCRGRLFNNRVHQLKVHIALNPHQIASVYRIQ